MMCDEQRTFWRWRREINMESCFCCRGYRIKVELLRKEIRPGKRVQRFAVGIRISMDMKWLGHVQGVYDALLDCLFIKHRSFCI